MTKQKQGAIRRKILLGYALLALVSAAAVFVLYQGITQIVSLESANSTPNIKLKKINKLLGAIYESESFSHSYFLSRNEEDLLRYVNSSEQIENEVNSFRNYCKGNKAQEVYLMEINHLLVDKRSIIQQLIDFNLKRNQDSLYQKAINEVYTTTYEHFDKPVVISRKTTIKRDTVYKEPKKNSFFKRLKNVFVHSKDSAKETTKVNIVETQQYDTIKPYKPKRERVVKSVKTAFFHLKDKEAELREKANEKEMSFLSSDRAILERIRSIVAQIETEELHYTNSSLIATQNIIKQSIWIIVSLSVLALLLMAVFMVIISRDIARSNAYQKALRAAQQQAESLLKLKEQFVANISHEIRTPLSAITGFSEQLQKTNIAKEKNTYATHIQQATEHLHHLVNQVLDLSKVQAGMLQLEIIPFKIESIIDEVSAMFSQQAENKRIKLITDIQNQNIPVLMGDPFRVRQILINLVGNALKFTSEGSITLSMCLQEIKPDNATIKIAISDTGIGIASDKLKSVFEEFTQAEQGTSRQYGGTGLGLSIARKLTEVMKGKIQVESELGAGSTFFVTIPFHIAENQDLPIENKTITPELLKEINLLFVEDDETIRLLISKIMENNNISCKLAANGEEALQFINACDFDLIFSDIQMPGMNGFELVKEIRKTITNIPIIALTARNEKIEIYQEYGFNDVLSKPYKENQILEKIAKHIPQITIQEKEIAEEIIEEVLEISVEEKANSSKLFNIESLFKFIGNDPSALIGILEAFIGNTRQDLELIQNALKESDADIIGARAHKMLSMYRQLEINSLLETLELLEQHNKLELPFTDIALLTEHLCSQTIPILKQIEDYIAEIKVNA